MSDQQQATLKQRKPVVLAGFVAAVLPATIALLGAFQILDAQQLAAVSGVATAIVGFASKWAAGQVYSAPTHEAAVAVAAASVPPETAAALAEAEGRASVADQIVAKLGPPPPGPSHMTPEQLGRIRQLMAALGRPWHESDPNTMLQAISFGAAQSQIAELENLLRAR